MTFRGVFPAVSEGSATKQSVLNQRFNVRCPDGRFGSHTMLGRSVPPVLVRDTALLMS